MIKWRRMVDWTERAVAVIAFGSAGIYAGWWLGDGFLGTNIASRQGAAMITEDDHLQARARLIRGVFTRIEKRLPEEKGTILNIPHDRAGRVEFDRVVRQVLTAAMGTTNVLRQDIVEHFDLIRHSAWTLPKSNIFGHCTISVPADYRRVSMPVGERDDTATIAITVAHELAHCRVAKNREQGRDSLPDTGIQTEESFADVRAALVVGATWAGWVGESARYQLAVRQAQKKSTSNLDDHDTIFALETLMDFLTNPATMTEVFVEVFGTPMTPSTFDEWLRRARAADLDDLTSAIVKRGNPRLTANNG